MYKIGQSSLTEFIQKDLIQARLGGTVQITQHVINSLYLRGERGRIKYIKDYFAIIARVA